MIDVAIVGAGELGGSIAHVLARRGIAARVQLIDPFGQIAAGKALDIMQAGPVERFTTPVAGSTDISRVAGADVVVVADRARPTSGDDALLPLVQVRQLAGKAVIICAGVDGRVQVERGVNELNYPRERLIGSAPEALAAALRALLALQTNGSVREVALTMLGIPPAHVVVDWEASTIGGQPTIRLLEEPTLRRLSAQAAHLWPPGPHALAHAAVDAVAAVCGVSRRAISGFAAPDASAGRRMRTVAMPIRLGLSGVVAFDEPAVSAGARVALDNARVL